MCSIGQILCRIKICSQHLDGEVNARLLIFVHVVLQLGLSQLVESNYDEGNENVDEEEREDNEENNVEDCLLSPVPRYWTHVLVS